jgi:hypothetical protein
MHIRTTALWALLPFSRMDVNSSFYQSQHLTTWSTSRPEEGWTSGRLSHNWNQHLVLPFIKFEGWQMKVTYKSCSLPAAFR